MQYPFLQFGASGEFVKILQRKLQKQGFFKGAVRGNYRDLTLSAVTYFQMSHFNSKGEELEVDGKVGKETWWAINNPSGSAQSSGLLGEEGKTERAGVIPSGITGRRKQFLQWLLAEHAFGVKEIPDGSNKGPRIDAYLKNIGLSKQPWCYALWGFGMEKVTGQYPFGKKHGHCKTGWNQAKAAGDAFAKATYTPIPGDAQVMLYRKDGKFTGAGHISTVVRVSKDRRKINTIGGNEGNRIKFGIRNISSSAMVGFINTFGDERERPEFELGIIEAASVDAAATR